MKTLKKSFVILIALLFAFQYVNAQDSQPTMFLVHTDHVKFEKIPQYEEMASKLKKSCEDHDMQNINWTAVSVEDGRYVYVSPIANMSELDQNPMGELAKKMGEDKMGKMFADMDECYDSHHDAVIHLIPELSYIPEGYSTKDKNQREYHFIYYTPKNAKEMRTAMSNVKEMFNSKGIKNGYEVYHSGFGSDESYYMVSVAGENDLAIAQGGAENSTILGDEADSTMFEVIKLASRYDKVGANIRPDLSYIPTNTKTTKK